MLTMRRSVFRTVDPVQMTGPELIHVVGAVFGLSLLYYSY